MSTPANPSGLPSPIALTLAERELLIDALAGAITALLRELPWVVAPGQETIVTAQHTLLTRLEDLYARLAGHGPRYPSEAQRWAEYFDAVREARTESRP